MTKIVGFSAGNAFVQIMLSGGERVRFEIGDEWQDSLSVRDRRIIALNGKSVTICREVGDTNICKVAVNAGAVADAIYREYGLHLGFSEVIFPVQPELGVYDAFIPFDCERRNSTVKVWIVQDAAIPEK